MTAVSIIAVVVVFSVIALVTLLSAFGRYLQLCQKPKSWLRKFPRSWEPGLRLAFDIVLLGVLVGYSIFVVWRVFHGQNHPITVYEFELHPEEHPFTSPSWILCPCNTHAKLHNVHMKKEIKGKNTEQDVNWDIPFFDIRAGQVNNNGVLHGLGLDNDSLCYMSEMGAFEWRLANRWARVHITANVTENDSIVPTAKCALFGLMNNNNEKDYYKPNRTRLYRMHHIALGEVHEVFQWTEYNYQQIGSTTRLFELISTTLVGAPTDHVSLFLYPANIDVVHNRQINAVSLWEMIGAFSGLLSLLMAVKLKAWGPGEYKSTGAVHKYLFLEDPSPPSPTTTENQPTVL